MSSQTARLHQLTVGRDSSAPVTLYPTAFVWSNGINQANHASILVFSYDFLDSRTCLSVLGAPICLTTLSATRTPTTRTGIVESITYQHSDGALHFYNVGVVSPDWLLTQSLHTRSFHQQSSLDIISHILSDYDFEWQATDQVMAMMQSVLPLRTQCNISDWDFITSLLADAGISAYWVSGADTSQLGYWLFTDDGVANNSDAAPLHYHYAQSSVQSGQDSVDELQLVTKQLGSRHVIVHADGLSADTVYEGMAHDESALCTTEKTVLIGSPSRVASDEAAMQLAKLWVAANHCRRERYQAMGAMRGIYIGSRINIHGLPVIDHINTHCLSTTYIGIEPDSDSVSYQYQAMIQDWLEQQPLSDNIPSHAYETARLTGVWVTATLLDAVIPYCPYPSSLSLASSTYSGLTQARTGVAAAPSYDASISDDNLQQTATTPVYAGISPHDDGTTPPLRTLQLSSGSSHGWQFAPRQGQPVLLNHWYGDIDSPVISRALYDGIGMGDHDDTDVSKGAMDLAHRHNAAGGASPRWHGAGLAHSQINKDDSHSGWVSGIAQYGLTNGSEVALSFDDTPNKLGLWWSVNTEQRADAMTPTITDIATFTPQQHVIELGVLRHRFSNHQSADSGHGFRVASDNSLQMAGQQGVLLSTFGIRHSQAAHDSAWVNDAGQQQLKLGAELSATYQEAKQAHLQDPSALQSANQSLTAFKTKAQVIDDSINTETLGAADVLMVSRDSILASSSNTLWTANTIIRQSGKSKAHQATNQRRGIHHYR